MQFFYYMSKPKFVLIWQKLTMYISLPYFEGVQTIRCSIYYIVGEQLSVLRHLTYLLKSIYFVT